MDRSRPELSFDIRERLQADEKWRIGAAGAALVHDGESIVMDASTTALSVARHLKARGGWSQLTVITNGLRLASELAGHPGIIVLMLGGRVRWEALSVVGQLGDGLFSRINVQKAFLGAAGFTVESGMADATDEEAQIKRSMVARRPRGDRHRRPHQVGTGRVRDLLPDRQDQRGPDRRSRADRHGPGPIRPWRRGPAHRTGRDRRAWRRGSFRRDEVATVIDAPPDATPTATAPPRRAPRHLEAVRRHPGARRRIARARRRRGPRPGRRERGRQEHTGQDPGRCPPARQRDDPAERRADQHPRTGPGARPRDRRGPPGTATLPGPHRGRERVHRARTARAVRVDRLGRDPAGGEGPVRGARRPVRCRRAGPWACRWPINS